jgi:hypothetical protein
MKEAQGLDSLLGMRKDFAMALIAKYHFTTLSGFHYPYIKEVFKIENFNKWQHPATLYIFVDSSDRICKLNYFFKEMPDTFAKRLEDSAWWAQPQKKYPEVELPKGELWEDGLPYRPTQHRISTGSWSGILWQDNYYSEARRFFLQTKNTHPKVFYSVGIFGEKFASKNNQLLRDDIYEPILAD